MRILPEATRESGRRVKGGRPELRRWRKGAQCSVFPFAEEMKRRVGVLDRMWRQVEEGRKFAGLRTRAYAAAFSTDWSEASVPCSFPLRSSYSCSSNSCFSHFRSLSHCSSSSSPSVCSSYSCCSSPFFCGCSSSFRVPLESYGPSSFHVPATPSPLVCGSLISRSSCSSPCLLLASRASTSAVSAGLLLTPLASNVQRSSPASLSRFSVASSPCTCRRSAIPGSSLVYSVSSMFSSPWGVSSSAGPTSSRYSFRRCSVFSLLPSSNASPLSFQDKPCFRSSSSTNASRSPPPAVCSSDPPLSPPSLASARSPRIRASALSRSCTFFSTTSFSVSPLPALSSLKRTSRVCFVSFSSSSASSSLSSASRGVQASSSSLSMAAASLSVNLAAQGRLAVTAPSVASLPPSSSLLARRQDEADRLLRAIAELTTMEDSLAFFSDNKNQLRPAVFLALLKRMQLIATAHLVKQASRHEGKKKRQPTGESGIYEEPPPSAQDSSLKSASSPTASSVRPPHANVFRAYFHRFPRFREVQRLLLSKVDSFPVADLLSSLDILQELNVCPRLLLRAAAPLLLQQLPQLSLEQVVQLLTVYVHPNSAGPHGEPSVGAGTSTVAREVTHWLHACGGRLGKLDGALLADLADAGSRMPINQVALLRLLLSPVRQRMHLMNAKQLSLVLHAYAKHPTAGDDFVLHQGLTLLLSRHSIPAMSLNAALRCIWAGAAACSPSGMGCAGRSPIPSLQKQQHSEHLKLLEILLKRAEPALLLHADQLDGQAVATLVWACSRGGACLGSSDLLQMLHRRALRVHSQMSPQGLSNTLWGFATTLGRMVDIRAPPEAAGAAAIDPDIAEDTETVSLHEMLQGPNDAGEQSSERPSSSSATSRNTLSSAERSNSKAASTPVSGETLCVALFQQVEPQVLRSLARFEPQDLAVLSSAYALLRCGSEGFHAAVQQVVTEHWADELSADQLVRIVYAYAVLRGSSRMFSAVQVNLLRRLETFTVHGLCDVIWSYVVMRYLDPQFLEMCLSLVPLDRVAGDDRCALLYPAASEIALALPTMDQIRLQRMRKYTREAFWEMQLFDFPSAFASSVAQTARMLRVLSCVSSVTSQGSKLHTGDTAAVDELQEGDSNEKEGENTASATTFDESCGSFSGANRVVEAFDFEGYFIDVWLQQTSGHARASRLEDEDVSDCQRSQTTNAERKSSFSQAAKNETFKTLLESGVALLCHTHATVHRETGKPLGSAIMRHRYLKRRNVPTVNVLWDVWKMLPTTEARVEYLSKQIVRALREEEARRASHALNRVGHGSKAHSG
ncbi:hypothetical protein TGRUB_209550 [Toxoplasma gondii RUB]|uniref:RAP domain-containing protein n=3 Tax=Toxoplasma gondii TaxID=5811 RepID=A0A086LV24_TOXGO|nr:hypothetical protein TGRUB_209550 [Toxoplasma gondii RUB]